MSTRSLIVRQNRDGSFDSITVSFGHPDWIGPTLVRHYTEETKIDALLALGSLSHLDRETGEKHDFERPRSGWCVAYGRDRGEEVIGSPHSENLHDVVQRARRLFIAHVFVWTVNPETGEKAWAKVRIPEETEESVREIVEEIWERHRGGSSAPLGIPDAS
jgi:hypothetical protein